MFSTLQVLGSRLSMEGKEEQKGKEEGNGGRAGKATEGGREGQIGVGSNLTYTLEFFFLLTIFSYISTKPTK